MGAGRRFGLAFTAAVIGLAALVSSVGIGPSGRGDAGAANPVEPTIVHGPAVVPKHFRGDLRDLPVKRPVRRQKLEVPEEPLGGFRKPPPTEPTQATEAPVAAMPTPSASFK